MQSKKIVLDFVFNAGNVFVVFEVFSGFIDQFIEVISVSPVYF